MRINWTDSALTDLANIESWLTANVDPSIAAELLERVHRHARTLLRFPRRKPGLGAGRHYSQVDRTPYLLIYSVARGAVTILRIRHNREDWRPPE